MHNEHRPILTESAESRHGDDSCMGSQGTLRQLARKEFRAVMHADNRRNQAEPGGCVGEDVDVDDGVIAARHAWGHDVDDE